VNKMNGQVISCPMSLNPLQAWEEEWLLKSLVTVSLDNPDSEASSWWVSRNFALNEGPERFSSMLKVFSSFWAADPSAITSVCSK
jgi:hypothetical protein